MDSVLASNQEGVWRHTGYKHYIRKHNQLARKAAELLPMDIPIEIFDESRIPSVHNTTAFAQSAYFQSVHGELSMLCSWLEQNAGTAKQQASSLATFLETKLRRAIFEKPEKEREVQDAVEQLLIGRDLQKGLDYDRETGRVKVSVKESVPDFVLRPMSLALEIKLAKNKRRLPTLVEEISADIIAYSAIYESLIFLVYDLGTIDDETQFKLGLESRGNVRLLVVKH